MWEFWILMRRFKQQLVTGEYDVDFDPSRPPPYTIEIPVSQAISPNDTDRFELRLSYVPEFEWRHVNRTIVHGTIALVHDEDSASTTPIELLFTVPPPRIVMGGRGVRDEAFVRSAMKTCDFSNGCCLSRGIQVRSLKGSVPRWPVEKSDVRLSPIGLVGHIARSALPDGSGVEPVIEEQHECAAPVAAEGMRTVPTSGSRHFMRREVQGVDFGFGQIMPSSHIALRPRLWKSGRSLDQFLVPSP